MTTYAGEDLEGEWEFKIVRSDTAAFRKREALEKLLEQEAVAGWIMVEKFDNSRIRFKRLRQAREQDAYLPKGVEPYRSHYGTPMVTYSVMAGVLFVVLMLGLALLMFALVS